MTDQINPELNSVAKSANFSASAPFHSDEAKQTIPVATGIIGQTDAQPTEDRNPEEILKACAAVSGSTCVFRDADSFIIDALAEGYKTHCAIVGNETLHKSVIEMLMDRRNRERCPSLKKPAYNATCLACNPDTAEDFARCSEWSYVIHYAALEKVPIANFKTWAVATSIRNAKKAVRAARDNAKANSGPNRKVPAKPNEAILERLTKLDARLAAIELSTRGTSAKAA